jgi:hypothetical protein
MNCDLPGKSFQPGPADPNILRCFYATKLTHRKVADLLDSFLL